MPTLPPIFAPAPYDTLDYVLNIARALVGDTLRGIGGEILTDTYAPGSPLSGQSNEVTRTIANAAWRDMQAILRNLGLNTLTPEVVLTNCPACLSPDPTVQQAITWSSYFDGAGYFMAPVLPADLVHPIHLAERPSGYPNYFSPMRPAIDGLRNRPHEGYNREWEWRQDAIYLPGAAVPVDLRIRYARKFADFATTGNGPGLVLWQNQPIPIVDCADALANFIAAKYTGPRGDQDASGFITAGEKHCREIVNREISAKQRGNYRRQSYSGRRRACIY